MWIPDFVLKIFGRKIATSLKLEEGTMDGTKKWYTSKNLWSCVISGLLGTYLALIQQGVHLPEIPAWILTLLGAVGVYSRATATEKLTV